MTDQIDNGGPAFPTAPGQMAHNSGMTLRDWFAGQALVGMTADGGDVWNDAVWNDTPREAAMRAASLCYGIADAMLAVRGGGAA
ncbi:hypothetical protein Shpa_37 [Paracoccus phage Shpa]|uniref:Uncharacterized protein n=1 Tax=Paracoccus phage Shpa TaxID=1647282 RepID=A0A0U2BX35_9CAUD|nr:hypothetical protein FDG85_gp37 [Paracoccus phage Shpa]AKG94548.1 hypothetical protein Shpa_37 [Paracoccus phage Shpa]